MLSTLALLTATFTGTFAFAIDGTYDPSDPVGSNAAIVTALTEARDAINEIDVRKANGSKVGTGITLPDHIIGVNTRPSAYQTEITVITLSADFKNGLSTSEDTEEVVSIAAGWNSKLLNLQNIVYLGLVGTQTPINEWTGTAEISGPVFGLAAAYNQIVSDINDNAALVLALNNGSEGDFSNYATTLERIEDNVDEFNKAWDEVVTAVNAVNPIEGITVVGLDTTNLSDEWTKVAQ